MYLLIIPASYRKLEGKTGESSGDGRAILRVHSREALEILSGIRWKARIDTELVLWPLHEHRGTLGLKQCAYTLTHSFLSTFKILSLSPSIQGVARERVHDRAVWRTFPPSSTLGSLQSLTLQPQQGHWRGGEDGGSVSWGQCLSYHRCSLNSKWA